MKMLRYQLLLSGLLAVQASAYCQAVISDFKRFQFIGSGEAAVKATITDLSGKSTVSDFKTCISPTNRQDIDRISAPFNQLAQGMKCKVTVLEDTPSRARSEQVCGASQNSNTFTRLGLNDVEIKIVTKMNGALVSSSTMLMQSTGLPCKLQPSDTSQTAAPTKFEMPKASSAECAEMRANLKALTAKESEMPPAISAQIMDQMKSMMSAGQCAPL